MLLLRSECVVCASPSNGICDACASALVPPEIPPLLAINHAVALCSYEGTGAELIQSLKFQNRRQALGPIADALAQSLPRELDAIVPIPPDPRRLRERGYDIPSLLAKKLARRLQVPVQTPLERVTTVQQTGRSRSERQTVEFRTMKVAPERVLLVDDVITTGATAVAGAVALGLAGSREISFTAIASTPARRGEPSQSTRAVESILS